MPHLLSSDLLLYYALILSLLTATSARVVFGLSVGLILEPHWLAWLHTLASHSIKLLGRF